MKQYFYIIFSLLLFSCGDSSQNVGNFIPTEASLAEYPASKFALEQLNQEISGFGTEAIHYYQRAKILQQQGKLKEATDDMAEALKLETNNSLYHFFYALLLHEQKNTKLAYDQAKKAELLGLKDARLYNLLGQLELQQNKKAEAKKYIDVALGMAPYHGENYYTLAAYQLQHSDTSLAISNLNKALSYKPKHLPSYKRLSEIYNQLGQTDLALELSAKLALQYPNDVENLNTLGRIYARRNRADSALMFYEKALNLKPDLYQASYDAGLISLKTKNFAKALQFFESTKKYAPRTAQINTLLAICNEGIGKYEEAYDFYTLATSIDDSDVRAWKGRQRMEKILYGISDQSSYSPSVQTSPIKKDSVAAPIKIEAIQSPKPRLLKKDSINIRFQPKN